MGVGKSIKSPLPKLLPIYLTRYKTPLGRASGLLNSYLETTTRRGIKNCEFLAVKVRWFSAVVVKQVSQVGGKAVGVGSLLWSAGARWLERHCTASLSVEVVL